MNAFLSFFGKVTSFFSNPKVVAAEVDGLKIAGTVLKYFNPGLGSVVETVANVVYTVECSAGSSDGATKKATAQSMLDASAPAILEVLSKVTGQTVDPAAASASISTLIDEVVTVLNDLGVFAHKTPVAGTKTNS